MCWIEWRASIRISGSSSPRTSKTTSLPLRSTIREPGTWRSVSGTASPKRTTILRVSDARSSSMRSTATRRPARSTATRVQVRSTSDRTWEEWNTVRPASPALRRSAKTSSRTSGSSPVVGSSSTSRSGSCCIAPIRPTFCFVPRELSRMGRSMSAGDRRRRSQSSARNSGLQGTAPVGRSSSRKSSMRSPDNCSSSCSSPGRYPTRARTPGSVLGSPNRRASPRVGRMRSSNRRIVVVFPAPFGPRKPRTSPGSTVKSSPSSPTVSPYFLVRSRASMTGVVIAPAYTPTGRIPVPRPDRIR